MSEYKQLNKDGNEINSQIGNLIAEVPMIEALLLEGNRAFNDYQPSATKLHLRNSDLEFHRKLKLCHRLSATKCRAL